MQQETGCPTGSNSCPGQCTQLLPPTVLSRGAGQRPWAWPPAELGRGEGELGRGEAELGRGEAELGREEALFQQAPQQGSFPGAFNAQTAPEGETLLVGQDCWISRDLRRACTGRQDSWKAPSSLTELQEWHQAPVGKWPRAQEHL